MNIRVSQRILINHLHLNAVVLIHNKIEEDGLMEELGME